jgi:hypothetical protein
VRNPQTALPVTILSATVLPMMKFLLLISNAFINTMGITQPSPQAAKRAAFFIVTMLAGVVVAIVTVVVLAVHMAGHH